jgi:hypothetical protein
MRGPGNASRYTARRSHHCVFPRSLHSLMQTRGNEALRFRYCRGRQCGRNKTMKKSSTVKWKEFTAKETLAEERKVHPAKAIEGLASGYLLAVASKTGERR